MNRLDQTVDDHLKTIVAKCPHLLNALHYSPEAVWGDIQVMESACRAINEVCRDLPDTSEAATKIMNLVAALRGQFAQQGLMDHKELETFREEVLAIRCCASTLRDALNQTGVL